jgi:hypothetical protein
VENPRLAGTGARIDGDYMPKLPPEPEAGKRGIEGNFLMVPVWLLDLGVSYLAALTWGAIYMHGKFGSVQISIERLAMILHRGRRQVGAALSELETAGVLTRRTTRGTSWYRLEATRKTAQEVQLSHAENRTTATRKTAPQPRGKPRIESIPPQGSSLKGKEKTVPEVAVVPIPRAADFAEWRRILAERHPTWSAYRIGRTVKKVEFELNRQGRRPEEFFGFDVEETTGPGRVKGTGYYVDLARRVPRPGAESNWKENIKDEEEPKGERCPHCGGHSPWGVEPGSDPMRPCSVCSSSPEAVALWKSEGMLSEVA